MNRFQACLEGAEQEIKRKREHAKTWAHVWNDPYTYLDEEDTTYNKQGGIDWDKSKQKLRDILYNHRFKQYEIMAFLHMYATALSSYAKVVHVDFTPEPKVIRLPRTLIKETMRDCAICSTQTRSGIHALCDSCHDRFIVHQAYYASLTFEYVSEAIWRADTRHHAKVRKLNAA